MYYRLRLAFVLCIIALIAVRPLVMANQVKEVLVVAGDENFPPYEFVDHIYGTKVYRGFNVDLLQAIALSSGFEIQFRPMPWADALQALNNGEVDAIGGMKYDGDREKLYDFSESYMINSLAIFVAKDTQMITSINDLAGKKVAVQKNDIGYSRLQQQPVELVPATNQEEALKLLLERKVDAAFGNKLTGQFILQRAKKLDSVKTVGGAIDPERYCVAVKKGNPALGVFNQGLQEIKRNGAYDKLYAKWFGDPVDYPAQYYKRNYQIALAAVILLFIAAAVIVPVNLFLRLEVKKRVREIQVVNDELRQKNSYIERAHKYQEKMLNSGYSGIVTIGQDGGIKFANLYAEQYLSCDGGQLAGRNYFETRLHALFQDSPWGSKPAKSAGQLMLGQVYIEYNIDDLQVNGEKDIIVYFRDITQEKHWREELIKKDKLEALGKLVACIAHEIRTPLTSIKTFVELLPAKYDNPLFREKISEFVPQEIERLNGIVTDLLTYAHPRKVCRERVSLKSLVDGLKVFFADALVKQRVDFRMSIDDKIVVQVDVQQIKQVIINILLNAIQALEKRPDPCLHIAGMIKDGQPCLTVADNGIGIDQYNINHIFEPFFSTKEGGTGLGLFVSYQLASQNEVQIIFNSEAAVGTEVTLKFTAKEGKHA